MKKLELNQMEILQGGNFKAGFYCGLGLLSYAALIAGTGGTIGLVAIAIGGSAARVACASELI